MGQNLFQHDGAPVHKACQGQCGKNQVSCTDFTRTLVTESQISIAMFQNLKKREKSGGCYSSKERLNLE